MKPAYCEKILGHSVQTFLTTYARFIDADADAEQAAIWAILSKSVRAVSAHLI